MHTAQNQNSWEVRKEQFNSTSRFRGSNYQYGNELNHINWWKSVILSNLRSCGWATDWIWMTCGTWLVKKENITLWCIEVPIPVTRKRSQLDANADTQKTTQKAKKKLKNGGKEGWGWEIWTNFDRKTWRKTCTPFQYKLWAKMYVGGGHLSLEESPSAAIFRRDNKQSKKSHSNLL